MDFTFVAMLVGLLGALFLFFAVSFIISIIPKWVVFNKAGVAGWKSIIPFYSDYLMYNIAYGSGKRFWYYLASSIVSSLLLNLFNDGVIYTICVVASFILAVFSLVIVFSMFVQFAKVFGKGSLFGIGLFFLTFIFLCILAFGKATYTNPNSTTPEIDVTPV